MLYVITFRKVIIDRDDGYYSTFPSEKLAEMIKQFFEESPVKGYLINITDPIKEPSSVAFLCDDKTYEEVYKFFKDLESKSIICF